MSFFSGIVDPNEHIRLGGYPQPFVPALGLQVLDWAPLGDGETLPVRFGDGSEAHAEMWTELIAVQGAEVLATFAATHLEGHPAVTLNHFGSGTAQYIGAHLDRPALARSLRAAWVRAGVKPVAEVPDGVEAVRRNVKDGSLLFLLNHGSSSVEVAVAGEAVQLSGGSALSNGRLHLEARDVAILREKAVSARTKTV
jgi:beta-galactosidase